MTCATITLPLTVVITGCSMLTGIGTKPFATVETINLATSQTPQQIVPFVAPIPAKEATVVIRVEVDHPAQTMDGIGGAFNELGWEALQVLSETDRQNVLRELFDRNAGAGLCFNRLPIGASDFAKVPYSLDDETDDWDLRHFSIKRDEGCLIPYILAAQTFNPDMKFHASPWSPPGWMKTTGKTTGQGGKLIDDDRTLKAHAAYFVKYLDAYAGYGIKVNRLCPQNESLQWSVDYPNCGIQAPLFMKSVRDYIEPAVKNSGLKTEVYVGTIPLYRQETKEDFDAFMSNTEFWKNADGISFQYSHTPWVRDFHKKYPNVPIMFSETVCYNGDNTVKEAITDFHDFLNYTRSGCSLFTYWNMVLGGTCKSTWGWRQNSLVVIQDSLKRAVFMPSFAVAKILSRHVVPGSRFLPATVLTSDAGIGVFNDDSFIRSALKNGSQVAAFQKPDRKIVVYMMNQGSQTKARVEIGEKTFDVMLPQSSLCAVILTI